MFLMLQILYIFLLLLSANATIDTYSSDGAWCWFGDPRAIFYGGAKKQTYIGWITKDGSVMVSSYDHTTEIQQEKLIHANLQVDDHDNPSIFFLNDGRPAPAARTRSIEML